MLAVILQLIFLFPYLLIKNIKDKKERGIFLYGTYGYFGLAGSGKTMAMTKRLIDYRKKYGDKIYIMTNYFFEGQDFPFTTWRDLLKEYDKPLVVAWDELPREFSSRDFKDFPSELISELTQLRKGNGVQILYSSQDWFMIDKYFRQTSFGCFDCKTILGNFTFTKLYSWRDFDALNNTSEADRRRKIKPKCVDSFVQTKALRNSYNSYKRLEFAKSKEYMDRTEIAQIYRMGE